MQSSDSVSFVLRVILMGFFFRPDLRAKLLLVFAKKFCPLHQRLSFNVLREVCQYYSKERFLASADGSTLYLFDLASWKRTTRRLDFTVCSGTAQCLISKRDLFIVGGCSTPRAARRLDLLSLSVAPQEEMQHGRAWPGICVHAGSVWVFGGVEEATSEHFSLSQRQWLPLPDMATAKMSFSPCADKQLIYLPHCAANNEELEVLSTETMSYRQIQLKIYDKACESVAFLYDGELILLARSMEAHRWVVASGAVYMEHTRGLSQELIATTNGVPVRKGRSVFWVTSTNKLVVFNRKEGASLARINE